MNDLNLYFQYRCERGLAERGLDKQDQYKQRLKYEIDTIIKCGFAGYFLVVSDIVNWAINSGIPVGPGRGSAAGALVSYVLKITHLDPIKYGLIFERFMNPERISMPDIDLDFCEARRSEVFDYVINKYGTDHVAHIGTFGSMKARAAIRDVARTLGLGYDVGDEISSYVLPPIEGKTQSLAVCYEKVPELRNMRGGANSTASEVLKWAEQFEDRLRSFGTHASGIVISDTPISQTIPLYRGAGEVATTQFDMHDVEEVGLIKFDFLGLSALTTIDRCVKSIAKRYDIRINPLEIPVDDEDTYAMLRAGDVEGVFQLEGSSGIRDLLVQIRPNKLDDLAVLVAIYRPGPLGSQMLEHYLQVRAGYTTPNYLIPELESILGNTDGMLIYQEQVLEICKQLAGYTMGEADLMRRAVGKKKEKEMAEQESKFKKGMVTNGHSIEVADAIWDDIKAFASYGFNRAHAACYGYIGYQMAYLKCHYPLDFMCSCLVTDSGTADKVIKYLSYCAAKGIKVLPPEVNESGTDFTITADDKIRFGLSVIKHVGKSMESVIEERYKNGPFKDIIQFAERVGLAVDKRQFEALVLAGAFDGICRLGRSSLMGAIEDIIRYREEQKRYAAKLETYTKRLEQWRIRDKELEEFEKLSKEDRRGKKRLAPIKVPPKPILPNPPNIPVRLDMSISEKLTQEKELLGYYVSGHPLDLVKETYHLTIEGLKEKESGIFTILAIPSIIKEITTKKTKKLMAYVVLEDKTGTMQAVALPDPYATYNKLINSYTPALYTGQLEITQGDEDKVLKFLLKEVTPLRELEDKPSECQIVVPVESAESISKFLKGHKGTTTQVAFLVSAGGNLWSMGRYGCSLSEEDIQKRVGEYHD